MSGSASWWCWAVTGVFDVVGFALAGLIPLIIGLVSLIGRRVIGMFNFTLAESPRGLRVTRGLTNLTSQSVPVNRIQGVRVVQPLLWRPLGWYRIDVNILGYGHSEGEDNDSSAHQRAAPGRRRRPGPTGPRPDPARHRSRPRSSCIRRPGGPGGCARSTSGPCGTATTTGS